MHDGPDLQTSCRPTSQMQGDLVTSPSYRRPDMSWQVCRSNSISSRHPLTCFAIALVCPPKWADLELKPHKGRCTRFCKAAKLHQHGSPGPQTHADGLTRAGMCTKSDERVHGAHDKGCPSHSPSHPSCLRGHEEPLKNLLPLWPLCILSSGRALCPSPWTG